MLQTFGKNKFTMKETIYKQTHICGGACSVMVIVVENEHGDTNSDPGRDWLHFI